MGVKKLWPELEQTSAKNTPIRTLAGKKIAVDLSSWIVEFRNSKGSTDFKTLFLRNTYYRTIELLGNGIRPVFVADGQAPHMKASAMKRRQMASSETQSGGSDTNVELNRPWLNKCARDCEELLGNLGVPFLYSDGEGEALCAALNSAGLVNGVMTNDVDAFLYGATTVYRNYRKDSTYKVFTVDVYEMKTIQSKLALNQRDMVVMALLCGCDYDESGVDGIGPAKALKLIKDLQKLNVDPLDRLCGWRENRELAELEQSSSKPPHCKNCEHIGERASHEFGGCVPCETPISCSSNTPAPCGCTWHRRSDYKLELSIREKAMKDQDFPNQMIINEYLGADKLLKSDELKYQPICVLGLKQFLNQRFLKWRGKFYPEISDLLATLLLRNMTDFLTPETTLSPVRIKGYRRKQHLTCLEVEWNKLEMDTETKESCYSIIVEKNRFERKFPDMMKDYLQSVSEKKGKKRKAEPVAESSQMQINQFFTVKK